MYVKVYDIIKAENRPMTKEEIAQKSNMSIPKVTINLLRLKEEGKIEGKGHEGTILWNLKEENEIDKKFKKLARD